MKPGVLCVDDEAILLLALTRGLRADLGAGVCVDGAASAEDAFAAMEELSERSVEVQVVVSDLIMPGMRGDDFLREVHRSRPGIRTILLTGLPDGEEEEALRREIGLFASLTKPCNNAKLARLIKEALADRAGSVTEGR